MAINGVANVWTITAADPNPGNDFVYQATSGTSGQTVVTADSWTPTGYNLASAWTVTNGQGSTDSGATWSASGQIAPGQSLKLRATVPAAFATTTVTAKIGTATGTWAVSGPSSLKVVFGYTGGWQTQTVPAGASTVTVKAWGAAGGSMQANGGGGGFAQATLSVTPGETLSILVGEGGCGYRETCSPFGGGGSGYFASGGGRSAVRRGSTELVTAGGGGGGGAIDPQSGSAAHGGAGGGTTGQASTPYSEANGCCSAGSAGGGTQTAGGSSHVPAGGTTIAGSGPNPGNASDPDYGGNAGRAFAGQRGAHGRVVLIFN